MWRLSEALRDASVAAAVTRRAAAPVVGGAPMVLLEIPTTPSVRSLFRTGTQLRGGELAIALAPSAIAVTALLRGPGGAPLGGVRVVRLVVSL